MDHSDDVLGTPLENEEHAHFQRAYEKVKDLFFSRNPEYWPCLRDPSFAEVIAFRARQLTPGERLPAYPKGLELSEQLSGAAQIPPGITSPGALKMLTFAAALSKDWENPASVENVISMPSDAAVYGTMLGTLANANLVYQEYSEMATELEKCVIRQMATLAGYDPQRATGIFTQGGTFCNLYGYLMGIRKSLPETKKSGMGAVQDYRFMNSMGGHYSNVTNLSVLGVDVESKVIRIKITQNNNIDLEDLERQLSACFQLKCRVPTIMLTMGTTDTFGVDDVKPVCDLRDRLCAKYEIKVKPHLHVDSAIGWTVLFFLTYDFEHNPHRINEKTLSGLYRNVQRFKELKYADSFTVDFQKWGYVPYTSSLVMFKEKDDLKYLENDPEEFSYFEKDLQGHTHLQSTLECSRGATGVFGAYAALNFMGVEGYQIIVAHCLQNANYLRCRLGALPFIKLLAPHNQGPSVGFRLYDPQRVRDAETEFEFEYRIQDSAEYFARIDRNNKWHRDTFLRRGKKGLFSNWVEFIARTDYDDHDRIHKLPGEKVVFMNPVTTRRNIDIFLSALTAEGLSAGR